MVFYCQHCQIHLVRNTIYCDVCSTMICAVNRQRGLVQAQIDWMEENKRLVGVKKRLLSGEEG